MNPFTEALPESYIGTKELMAGWGCSRQSIQRWKKQGLLTKIGKRIQDYYAVENVDALAKRLGRVPVNTFRETRRQDAASSGRDK